MKKPTIPTIYRTLPDLQIVCLMVLLISGGFGLGQQAASTTELKPPPVGVVRWESPLIGSMGEGSISGVVQEGSPKQVQSGVLVNLVHPYIGGLANKHLQVQTDSEGQFRFEGLPNGLTFGIFATDGNRLSFTDPNNLPTLSISSQHPTQSVTLKLTELPIQTLRFTDQQTGLPVEGVAVTLSRTFLDAMASQLLTFFPVPNLRAVGTSNEHGIWETVFFPGAFHLSYHKDGYVPVTQNFYLGNLPDQSLNFQHKRGGEISGKVLDADGRPLSGTLIHRDSQLVGISNAKGEFRFTGLDTDITHLFEFVHLGLQRRTFSHASFPMFSQKETLNVTLDNTVGSAVQVSSPPITPRWTHPLKLKFQTPSGKPLKNISFQVYRNGKVTKGRTNSESIFECPPIPLNFHSESFMLAFEGYAVTLFQVSHEAANLNQGRFAVSLREAQTVSGRLLDTQQKPIAGAEIRTRSSSGLPWHFWKDYGFVTDSEGRFAIEQTAPGIELRISAPGYQFQTYPLNEIPAQEKTFTLSKPMVFRGKVVDAAGKPVKDFQVTPLGNRSVNFRSLGRSYWVQSKDGSFEIRHMAANIPYRIFVKTDTHAGQVFGPFLPTSREESTVRILPMIPNTHVVEGKVLSAAKKPLKGVKVWAAAYDGEESFLSKTPDDPAELRVKAHVIEVTETDAKGKFRLTTLPENLKRIYYFYAAGYPVTSVEDQPNLRSTWTQDRTVILKMQNQLQVIAEKGAFPTGKLLVLWQDSPIPEGMQETTRNGPPWVFKNVEPGTYTVALLDNEVFFDEGVKTLAEQVVEIKAGATHTVHLVPLTQPKISKPPSLTPTRPLMESEKGPVDKLHAQLAEKNAYFFLDFQNYDARGFLRMANGRLLKDGLSVEIEANSGFLTISGTKKDFTHHLLAEDIPVSGNETVVDIGVLSPLHPEGIEVKLEGVPEDFDLPSMYLSVYRNSPDHINQMKLIMSPFGQNVKSGTQYLGIGPGSYTLKVEFLGGEGAFKPSWQKQEVKVMEGEIKEVTLKIEITSGCMIELANPSEVLRTVVFTDPKTQTEVYTAPIRHLAFSNRVRYAKVKPGTWTLQANTQDDKVYTRTVTVPEQGCARVILQGK